MSRVLAPTPEQLDDCNRRARRDGLLAGVTGGLVSAIYGQRALKLTPRKAMIGGAVAGALSGYFFSQAFLSSYLAQLRQEIVKKNAAATADILVDTAPGTPT
ncbi:hypothetical protein M422DRAFT_35455 [Sphaerobolus stellatus SS14]|uniref:Uncharacterized protein n=1 Tax=Sphaerobolus stellatus (strain SS14) TaxID=990650 RepID=A0A0C9V7Y5_SPHS4|nr:hypothetical protein M422DRAFT_35455 [Sphaerobolus stellatus SS14]